MFGYQEEEELSARAPVEDESPEDERIDLIAVEAEPKRTGVSLAVSVSLIVHVLLMIYLIRNYHLVSNHDQTAPIPRYVQLIKNDPRQFVESPGKKLAQAPLNAPLSDGNRKATMPKPTGDKPTLQPGDGGIFTPSSHRGDGRPQTESQQQQQEQQQQSAAPQEQSADQRPQTQQSVSSSPLSLHPNTSPRSTNGAPDWRNAIREAGKQASLGSGDQQEDINGGGGEKGFADEGPLSFESAWFPWGDYAQSMISRIRVNWEANMPQLLRSGLKGVVTIRFTIHRDGHITDVTILSSSGAPPYDFAAKKAIELSSPLNPLPEKFPNETERVTCGFYYNAEVPRH